MEIDFEDFKLEWLSEVTEGKPSSIELGNRFSRKIIMQWLELDEYSDDIVFCDGSGDGGIDIAYLHRGDMDNDTEGDTWYIVQSKYGSAFSSTLTLLAESQKFFETTTGQRKTLSSLSTELIERLRNFISKASEKDKLVLVFATVDALTKDEKRVLEDIKTIGRSKIGNIFDIESICIETIYKRVSEQQISATNKVSLPFKAQLVPSGNELLVGAVKLIELYKFLKDYKQITGDLDLIYEKNVRKFLGNRRKVNRGIENTIIEKPERFGLYNNGITIVVEKFEENGDTYTLTEPFIVNGCQTTKTIWSVLLKKLESGGTGKSEALEEYLARLDKGIVVVKIVKTGIGGEELLTETTRYTNSQNAVTEKDFLALEKDFNRWAGQMASKYGIFLEIQRGGWESRKALQKQNPTITPFFIEAVNCFDLIKVYSAGWQGEAGLAFGKNPPFAPGGSIFTQIINDADFGLNDLYAAYILSKKGDNFKFGRGAEKKQQRGQTRYLFFMVLIELLKDLILRANSNELYSNRKFYTNCIINLNREQNQELFNELLNNAISVVDEYMTLGYDNSIFTEPAFRGDINNFLKWEQINRGDTTPKLKGLIEDYKRIMRRSDKYHNMVASVKQDVVNNAVDDL